MNRPYNISLIICCVFATSISSCSSKPSEADDAPSDKESAYIKADTVAETPLSIPSHHSESEQMDMTVMSPGQIQANFIKPSEIFTGENTEFPIKSSKQIISLLERKGYQLVKKKTDIPDSNEAWGEYTYSLWRYRIGDDDKFCEVTVYQGFYEFLTIRFSTSTEASEFCTDASPYIRDQLIRTSDSDPILMYLSDYLSMEQKGSTIHICQCAE